MSSLSYSTLTRPSKNSVTLGRHGHRSAVRSATQAQTSSSSSAPAPPPVSTVTPAAAGASSSSVASAASSSGGPARRQPNSTRSQPGSARAAGTSSAAPGPAEDQERSGGCDTCTGYLTEVALRAAGGGRPSRLTLASQVGALQSVVALQAEVLAAAAEETAAARAQELAAARETLAALGPEAAGLLENRMAGAVLQDALEASREAWQRLLSERVNKLRRGNKIAVRSRSATSKSDDGDADEMALPSIAELYGALVDGLNSEETRAFVVDALFRDADTGDAPADAERRRQVRTLEDVVSGEGVASVGMYTVLCSHVQALMQFPRLAPSHAELQHYFALLHPTALLCRSYQHLDCSLGLYEAQLDALLRRGDDPRALSALLREGVHFALRRLVYARALGVDLVVTDGRPLFPADGAADMANNAHQAGTVLGYCALGTRRSRDKVRQRHQLHRQHGSPEQEGVARLLHAMAEREAAHSVGDSDKYFVFEEDVTALLQAVLADRSLPERLEAALRRGGRANTDELRRDGAGEPLLDAYLVYLQHATGDHIQQKAPPCGFFPVEGLSLLAAPLANVTGDTVEQYELLLALLGQVWARLQGPTPDLAQCCMIFERLVTSTALAACVHCTHGLGLPPLRLAIEWFLTGFAELLDPAETLELWDVLLAYHVLETNGRAALAQTVGLVSSDINSSGGGGDRDAGEACALWVLPVLAAALFHQKAKLIEACESKEAVLSLFSVGHQIKCKPLIQNFLFLVNAE